MGNSDAAEYGLAGSGGAVDGKAEVNQLIDHLLDLIFTRRVLHCDNHEYARFARVTVTPDAQAEIVLAGR